MKNKHVFGLLAFLMTMAGSNTFAQIQTFEWQDAQRQYLVRTPAEYDNTVPVLFFLHGLGDNITRLDNEFHFQQISEQLGWVIVRLCSGQRADHYLYGQPYRCGTCEDASHPRHQRSCGWL